MGDEYELLSHEEIEQLKREAERYKNNPFIKGGEDEKLYVSIVELNKSIKRMTAVFEDVKQQIIQEQETGKGPDAKMDVLLDQNRHIAQALVTFGEKLEDLTNKNKSLETEKEDKDDFVEEELTQKPTIPEQRNQAGIQQSNNQNEPNNTNFQNQNTQSPPQQNPINSTQQINEPNPFNQEINPDQFNQETDMDYKSWNYSKPNKPGVSQSTNYEQQINNNSVNQTNSFNPEFSQQGFQNQKSDQQNPNLFSQQQPQKQVNLRDAWAYQQDKGFGQFEPQTQENQKDQELNFPKPPSPNQEFQQETTLQQTPSTQNQDSNQMPNLKPITNDKPQPKRKKFGLF
ncbi:MAG: hypothetical protein ACLFN8_00315 [Candidatus Woesearchaeota archaeon]